MPVEIRELVIRAVTTAEADGDDEQPRQDSAPDQDAIVQACVKQVLRILKKKEAR